MRDALVGANAFIQQVASSSFLVAYPSNWTEANNRPPTVLKPSEKGT